LGTNCQQQDCFGAQVYTKGEPLSAAEFARQPFELRGYQREAVVGVFKSWEQFDRSLLIAPTGSGKTVIFAEIAELRQPFGRSLILAHRDELIDQAIDKLHRFKGLTAAKEKAQAPRGPRR
jgi:superfamily II DNA or RNA helicase